MFKISLKYDYNKAYNFLRIFLFYTVSAVTQVHEGYQQVVWTADQQEVYLLQQQQQLGQQQYQPNEDVGYTPTGFFGGQ